MDRFITKKLLDWKNRPNRKPLILRGARQVGKTHTVLDFGRSHFKGKVHHVDLEKHPEWHRVFEKDLAAKRILSELEILVNARITPGTDLLFIDEIQTCPRAIMALRYFYEEMPELHLIAAGSLLEFATKQISFSVGRVQILNMFPMSFPEFLYATGKSTAAEVVLSAVTKQPDAIHNMLLDELRRYFFIGGMPECVKIFVETGKLKDAFEVQADLVNTFRQDFLKYTPYVDPRCLNSVLTATAKHVGHQIKYSKLAEGFTNPTIKKAFDLLSLAQVIRKVPATSPAGLPLGAAASERKFKALMLDIGLMQHLCSLPVEVEYAKSDLLSIYQGALAEQFVGQEMLCAGQTDLYYWAREAKSSSAEVDYLIVKDGKIHPIEVKSGAAGKLKSLHLLLQNYPNCTSGYVFSSASYAELPEQKLIFLPLYYAFQTGRLE
ncbi:MAG: ATP-binding protein [candidate division KSB1 bacterium]|nr:ATP-binding protein [candidate division KSB1 bacterium]MDZ7313929.1 ATP-binding protein [candidate division KSB1 bacterium]